MTTLTVTVVSISEKIWSKHYRARFVGIVGTLLLLLAAVIGSMSVAPPAVHAASSGNWPMYLHDLGHSSYNPNETVINPSSVGSLKPRWVRDVSGATQVSISTQPVVSGGLVYWGSWDGYEHATDPSNPTNDVWKTYIGLTSAPNCWPPQVGVGSSATVASVLISGRSRRVLFVGGGDGTFYVLNATNGQIIWSTPLGSTAQGYFLWSSPAIFQNSVYMGVASFGDCPLIQGKVVKLNASNGVLQNVWYSVPNGCVGGGVWSSPAIDQAAGTLYFGTGTLDSSCGTHEMYAQAVVELRTRDLSLVGSYQPPVQEQIENGDFGASPTLFTARIGGTLHRLIGVANKGGIYYTFDRDKLGTGPVWQTQPLASSGDTISSSAWDGTNLYVSASKTTISGTTCDGSLQALNPASGTTIWQDCLIGGPVLGSVTVVPGLAIVGSGYRLYAIGTTTTATSIPGQVLFTFPDTATYHWFFAGPTISNGVMYAPNEDGNFYALTPNGQ